ncbi:hypothetical protein LTR17_018879 [Elasticomyces elasticus]|nr:hypothetical protein LTR17_018879 [Elasticomyces elasticus]
MKTGSCFCGKLRYEYIGEPAMTVTCHCLTCQKLSGSAFTTNICVPDDKYHVTSGTPKTYDWTHESGMKMEFSFCGDCGANISKTGDHDAFKGMVIVQAGSLDEKQEQELPAPVAELYVKQRVSWLPALGVGQIQELPEVPT